MRELMEMPTPQVSQAADPRRALLTRVFAVLNSTGARWCIAHGYEKYTTETPVDIDCVLDRALTPQKLAGLRETQERLLRQPLLDGAPPGGGPLLRPRSSPRSRTHPSHSGCGSGTPRSVPA